MKKITFIFSCSLLLLLGCGPTDKEIRLDGFIAKGDIKDSVFNGLIKFYDINTGKLKVESNYQNNVLNGDHKEFFDNGRVRIHTTFADGKINGYNDKFDSSGNKESSTFFYYDLKAGHQLIFEKSKLKEYYFYNLGGDNFYHINYDSIGSKGILDLENQKYFFIRYEELVDSVSIYWIANVNPPRYSFAYSLVKVDQNDNVTDTITRLNLNTALWYKVKVHSRLFESRMHYPAVMIEVKDSINGLDCTMLKKLP